MMKLFYLFFILIITTACKSPKEKIESTILYQDSIGYCNYEWPRDRAEYYGLTYKFMNKNKLQKLSFNKVSNKRWIWNDYPFDESIYRWGVSNDSIFTFMNYNSKIKVIKYNSDTIWLYDFEKKRNTQLIKVKGSLNIEKNRELKVIDKKNNSEIEALDI